VQCHPLPIAETGLWAGIPESLHEATVYEPPRDGKSTFRNVLDFEVLDGGILALAAAWGTEPIDPAASINDRDLVTEQQLIERGWKLVETIVRRPAEGGADNQRVFLKQVDAGEKIRLATRNLTPPFVIVPNSTGAATLVSAAPQSQGVVPVQEPSAAAWEAEAAALVGEWTLARGFSGDGLKESWQIRNNDGKWSVNRTFTDQSGKQVGAAASVSCKFSAGELQFTERWEKKPVYNYGEGGTITLRFADAALDRLEMNWQLGTSRGGDTLVRSSSK